MVLALVPYLVHWYFVILIFFEFYCLHTGYSRDKFFSRNIPVLVENLFLEES